MRSDRRSDMRSRLGILASTLVLVAIFVTGCGLQDWQRDLLGLVQPATLVPVIPVGGGDGAAGPPGQAGAPGPAGLPGPVIIIARAVINADASIQNADDVTSVGHPSPGQYQLTVDLTGDTLPAGTTEDDFEVFVTLKEGSGLSDFTPLYIPISLAGTTLRFDVIIASGQAGTDNGFSVMVLLPAGTP
jgi:hypothetical protein